MHGFFFETRILKWFAISFSSGPYFNDLENHKGAITHLKPDILESEVKWALGSILQTKLVEMMEFQPSYIKSQKMTLLKAILSIPENLENSATATSLEKVSFHSNPKERQCQRMFK